MVGNLLFPSALFKILLFDEQQLFWSNNIVLNDRFPNTCVKFDQQIYDKGDDADIDDDDIDYEWWKNPITSDRDICSLDILCCTCFAKPLIKSPGTEICRRWGSVWKYQKYAQQSFASQETSLQS